ncbi:MAG TPA: alpha/beta fold hydrolase [Microvirga sp.]|jgi:class 3 adenylate cyclase/pimeloyl-ACP methyl ester carboxylesterase
MTGEINKAQRRLAAILAADVVGYSALMGRDEEGALCQIKSLRREVIEPNVKVHRGRVFKTMGDGVLVEFSSPVEAVRCAVSMQAALAADTPPGGAEALRLRIGINLGDILIEEDGDVYGDGVNIAARLEPLAEPGGVCISGKVYEEVRDKLPYIFEDKGEQHVKNIARPVHVYAVTPGNHLVSKLPTRTELVQRISYCRAQDGVQLAWAEVGSGPPLVKAANWMNHLEYDWESPVFHSFLERLASDHTLIRYDARGNGMSDWDVENLSLDDWVSDLETVVDAAGLGRFPLLGISQGCAVSIAYAVRHPDRVSHLVLYGGFALGGRKRSAEERQRRDAMMTLMRLGWGADEPTFRQIFTSQFIPGGAKEQVDAFNELQRRTTSPDCAARYFEVVGNIDIRELLPQVKTPALVMHARDDRMCPFEAGRQMAAAIPGARFVEFEGKNHMILPGEPAFDRFFNELQQFLGMSRV